MAVVFFLTFTVGDFLKGYVEMMIDYVSGYIIGGLESLGAGAWVISLMKDGVFAGVGGVLSFVPNIFILFLSLGLLEDSGYLSWTALWTNWASPEGHLFRCFWDSDAACRQSWHQGLWKMKGTGRGRSC